MRPQWIKYDADDPATYPKERETCLVNIAPGILGDDHWPVEIDRWRNETEHWLIWKDKDVLYWMPAPMPPNFIPEPRKKGATKCAKQPR